MNFYEYWKFQHTRLNSEPVGPVHWIGQTGQDRSNRSGVAVRPLSRAALAPEQRLGSGRRQRKGWEGLAGLSGLRARGNGAGAQPRAWGDERAASIPSNRERNWARGGAVEVRGEVDGLRDGSGLKNGGETAGATSRGERRLCSACLLRVGARRPKRKRRNGVSLGTW